MAMYFFVAEEEGCDARVMRRARSALISFLRARSFYRRYKRTGLKPWPYSGRSGQSGQV